MADWYTVSIQIGGTVKEKHAIEFLKLFDGDGGGYGYEIQSDKLTIKKLKAGENLWDVSARYGNTDTLQDFLKKHKISHIIKAFIGEDDGGPYMTYWSPTEYYEVRIDEDGEPICTNTKVRNITDLLLDIVKFKGLAGVPPHMTKFPELVGDLLKNPDQTDELLRKYVDNAIPVPELPKLVIK